MKNIYDKAKETQERIDKGEVKIVSLGVINGIQRYKFVEVEEEDK